MKYFFLITFLLATDTYSNTHSIKKNTISFALEIPSFFNLRKSTMDFSKKMFQQNNIKILKKFDLQLQKTILISFFQEDDLERLKVDIQKSGMFISYKNKKNKSVWMFSLYCLQQKNCFYTVLSHLKTKKQEGFLVHFTNNKKKIFIQHGSKKFQISFKNNLIVFSNDKNPNLHFFKTIYTTKEYQILKKKSPDSIAQYYIHEKYVNLELFRKAPILTNYLTFFFVNPRIKNTDYILGTLEIHKKNLSLSQYFIPKNLNKNLLHFQKSKFMYLEHKIKDPIFYIQNHTSFQHGKRIIKKIFQEFSFLNTTYASVKKYLISTKPKQTALLIEDFRKDNKLNIPFWARYVLQQQYHHTKDNLQKSFLISKPTTLKYFQNIPNTKHTKNQYDVLQWKSKQIPLQQQLTFFKDIKQQTSNLFITTTSLQNQKKFYANISFNKKKSRIKKVHLLNKTAENTPFILYLQVQKILKKIQDTPSFYLIQQYISYISQIKTIQSIFHLTDQKEFVSRTEIQLN